MQPPLRRLHGSCTRSHVVQPVLDKKKKTRWLLDCERRACAAAAVMAARESEEDNKWTAAKRLEGEKRRKGDKFVLIFIPHPPLPWPSRAHYCLVSSGILGDLGSQVCMCARPPVCVCAVVRNVVGISGRLVRVLATLTRDNELSMAGCRACIPPPTPPPFMLPPLLIEVNINEVVLGLGLHKWRCKTYIMYTYAKALDSLLASVNVMKLTLAQPSSVV